MRKTIYCPFQSEDITFCDIFTCTEIASWICYPQGILNHAVLLCNQHKREREREERKQVPCNIELFEAEVKNALRDVDASDADALYERCGEILDDMHADHC
jgi:hypothetical protein